MIYEQAVSTNEHGYYRHSSDTGFPAVFKELRSMDLFACS